jgi:hypothetical protein
MEEVDPIEPNACLHEAMVVEQQLWLLYGSSGFGGSGRFHGIHV